jgi:biotin carboxyl carrier protein
VPAPAATHDVLAPLAGTVYSVAVRVGQSINAGDTVAVIEAMKMKTHVIAKFAGVVQRIAVKVQDSVDDEQVLMTIG